MHGNSTFRCLPGFWKAGILTLALSVWLTRVQAGEFESYFNYLNTYPSDNEAIYSEECQGVTTDGHYWFFARNQQCFAATCTYLGPLIKIPFTIDLVDTSTNIIQCGQRGIVCNYMNLLPELSRYNHVGDLSYYRYLDTQGTSHNVLIAPFEDTEDRRIPAFAVFDAQTLELIDLAEVTEHVGGYLSWVAVSPDGYLYSGRGSQKPGYIYKYEVKWATVFDRQPGFSLLKSGNDFSLLTEDGTPYAMGPSGGAFSESGNILYTSSGSGGVEAFDINTHRRIRQIDGPRRENEGLAVFDVDGLPEAERPPGISGQLHVVILENDDLSDDDVFFDHFTSRIYVDAGFTGIGSGTPTAPYPSVLEAYGVAWDGAILSIANGSYPERLSVTKRILLESKEGTAVIGQ